MKITLISNSLQSPEISNYVATPATVSTAAATSTVAASFFTPAGVLHTQNTNISNNKNSNDNNMDNKNINFNTTEKK